MSDWAVGGVGLTLLGTLLCWTAKHSIRDDVDYRRIPGLRTPDTLRSRESWRAAHRRIQYLLWRSGLAGIVIGVGCIVWDFIDGRGNAELIIVLCLVAFVPVAIVAYRVGNSAAREVSR
jgi:hypothetical protein